MARQYVSASSEHTSDTSQSILTAPPFTAACWFMVPTAALGTRKNLICAHDTSAFDGFRLRVVDTTDRLNVSVDASTFQGVSTTNAISGGTWHHGAAVVGSQTQRIVYLDGPNGEKATDATTDAGSMVGVDNFTLAHLYTNSTRAEYADVTLAEVAVWGAVLTDDEIQALADGYAPHLVHPADLIYYIPLVRGVFDYKGNTLDEGGTPDVADHPRIFYPSAAHVAPPVAAGTEHSAAAALAAAGSVSATGSTSGGASSPGRYSLRRIQFGTETTAGTAVAATHVLEGEGRYVPLVSRWRPAWQQGVRAAGAGMVNQQKGSLLLFESELDYEQILLFLETGLGSRQTTGSGPYTHTFHPDLSTAPSVGSATFEYIVTDGTEDHFEREFAYGTTQRLAIELAADQRARMVAEVFGRAEQPSTATGGLSPLDRTTIDSSDFTFYVDDSWAALGTTEKALAVEFATLDLSFGLAPDHTADGRDDLDFTSLRTSRLLGALSLTVEHNAAAAAEVAAWRAGTRRFIRMRATSGSKSLTFDFTGFYTATPHMSRDRDAEFVTLVVGVDHDATSTNYVDVAVVNVLAGI